MRATGRVAARTLTDAAIRNLKDGETRTDGSLPVGAGRLVIECRKARGSLRRRWLFRYRTVETANRIVLGDYPAVGLEEARKKARVHIEEVRRGVDPRQASREAKRAVVRAEQEKAELGSLRDLLSSYVAWLAVKGKDSARDVEQIFQRHVIKPWPQLAATPARAVTPEMMRDVLARMIKLGIRRQTNVVRSYLHAAFVHGAHADLDPRRAAAGSAMYRLQSNPMQLVPRIGEFETTRGRVLEDVELGRLWKALDGSGVEVAATIRCIVLLGGQRIRQVLRVTWQDYSKSAGTLRLVDTKGKRSHPVDHLLPVSKLVAKELEGLRAINGAGKHIFSTTFGEKPLHDTSISSVIGQIAKTATCRDDIFRPSDIRRTVETRLQALGVSREVRAQLLSHGRSSGVQARHYERYDYIREKRGALQLWESYLDAVVHRGRPGRARDPRAASVEADRPPTRRTRS